MFFRLIFAIPNAIVFGIIGVVGAIVLVLSWLVILITGKDPAGMSNFRAGVLRWDYRLYGYMFLLTDKYPPFSLGDDAAYPIRPSVQAQLEGRNRLTVFFRYILAIPQLIIVQVLLYAAEVVVLISWFAALFTGSVPEGLHNFMSGVFRWHSRVIGYLLLLTDQYPPFSLS